MTSLAPHRAFSDHVLQTAFQFLNFSEVAACSRVNKFWFYIAHTSKTCSTAEVHGSNTDFRQILTWMGNRKGMKDLTLNVDLRKVENKLLSADIERVFNVVSQHSATLETLTWNLPVDRFKIPANWSRSMLTKLYHASLLSQELPELNEFLLPRLETFIFPQMWEAWQFNLPELKHLSLRKTRLLSCVEFDYSMVSALDLGANSIYDVCATVPLFPNLQTLVLNITEFDPSGLQELWRVVADLKNLKALVLWQCDDFGVKAKEVFRAMQLDPNVCVYFGVLDPSFAQFDASILPSDNTFHIYGDNFVINSKHNVSVVLDNDLNKFMMKLQDHDVFAPGIELETQELSSEIYDVVYDTFGSLPV